MIPAVKNKKTCRKLGPNDVLVDRSTKWGNPFRIGIDGDREEVVRKHMLWMFQKEQYHLLMALDELIGKNLVCHCHPMLCHADNLILLVTIRKHALEHHRALRVAYDRGFSSAHSC